LFFLLLLEGKPLDRKAMVIAQDSSSEDDSDQEDPSNIDW
jgi:hypothetical protein